MQNSNSDNKKVVTRFAPSPTGFMHVGGVRTALYAWLLARKYDGQFILRIEDTDKAREVDGSIEHIKKSLKWLGLNWDQGPDIGGPFSPYIQSERLESYKKYAKILVDKGFAYADTSKEDDVEILRKKAEEEKRPFLFRDHRPTNPPVWDSTQPLRFKVPELKRYSWTDLVWGDLSAGPEALDDFILIKGDGFPTYNFAHIIDDIEMGVTHVMRGQEFISSMPKFLSIYEALDITPPNFATLPPIMGADGKRKLGKRDGAKDVLDYDKEGYLPETMINFLAFLGFNPGGEKEIYTVSELIKVFDLNKVQRSGAQWNDEKLDWMNKEHIKLMPENDRNKMIIERLKNLKIENNSSNSEELMTKLCPIIFDHISKWSDIDIMHGAGELNYYFNPPQFDKTLLFWKGKISPETAKKHLEKALEIFSNADDSYFSDVEKVKSLIFDYATENGRGDVLWPLRVALSGKEKSPDPFTLIYILGKKETVKRINEAMNA